MAFVRGTDTRVLVNEVAASTKLSSITAANARALSDTVAAFGDEGDKFVPGLRSGQLTLGGPFEQNTVYDEFTAANGVDNGLLVSAAMKGFAVGNQVVTAASDPSSHEMASQVTDAVRFTVEAMADELVDLGVSLHDVTAETATANGTNVDNAVSSANGGVGALHVTAYSGFTNVVFKVQHSADNITYTDLITFTTVTGITSERKTATGTVNRHVRAVWTVTGVGSITFAVVFARR